MTYNGRGTENTRELGQELRDTRHQRGLSQVKLAVILGGFVRSIVTLRERYEKT